MRLNLRVPSSPDGRCVLRDVAFTALTAPCVWNLRTSRRRELLTSCMAPQPNFADS